ncbi:unnamed protein product [Polarella glacialis]|uniref:Uncharacterized protein n=1 Tax=Polarella glacialis TaxID=89957 RepID=A0A813LWB9_POLGL|nr:unnamed protein product [Polarella glacialis]CAE8734640.1 unnamed protein product [Polarella glacialis]
MAAMAAMALPEQGPGLGALESSWLPEISPGRICFSLALLMVSAKARSEVASLNGPWQVLLSTLSAQVKPAESETDRADAYLEQMLATQLKAMWQNLMDAALVCLTVFMDVATVAFLMASVSLGEDRVMTAVRLFWRFFVFWGILYAMLAASSRGFYVGLSSVAGPSLAFSVNALLLCRLTTMPITPGFFFVSNSRMLMRICASMMNPNPRACATWHLLHGLATTYKYSQCAHLVLGLDEIPAHTLFFGAQELSVCVGACGLQYAIRHVVLTMLRAQIRCQTMHNEVGVARRLLSAMCDAQVFLGPDLTIAGSTEQFSRLLMTQPSMTNQDFQGVPFKNFVAEADKARFQRFIEEDFFLMGNTDAMNSPPPARSLHASLRDSASLQFSVEILHVRFLDADNQPRHLLGIREEDSFARLLPPHESAVGQDVSQVTITTPNNSEVLSSVPSSSSSASSAERPGRFDPGVDQASSQLWAGLESMEISFSPLGSVSASYSIHSYLMRFQGASSIQPDVKRPCLTDLLAPTARESFKKWCEEKLNFIWNHEGGPPGTTLPGLELRMPRTLGGLTLMADCVEMLGDSENSSESGSECSEDRNSLDADDYKSDAGGNRSRAKVFREMPQERIARIHLTGIRVASLPQAVPRRSRSSSGRRARPRTLDLPTVQEQSRLRRRAES